MIEIKKDDFLWKCYERYYKYEKDQPAPKSVCIFFWTAVMGMLRWLYWDSMFIISAVILAALSVELVSIGNNLNHEEEKNALVFWRMIILLVFIYQLVFYIARYVVFLQSKGRAGTNIGFASVCLLFFSVFSFIFGVLFKDYTEGSRESLSLEHIFIGCLITTGFILLGAQIFLIYSWFSTPSGQIVKAYIDSFKNWVCPLVKSPWDEEKEIKNET